jgi:hypothetical protein
MRALFIVLLPSLALAGPFKLPDGWVDLTPGVAPQSVYDQLDPSQRAEIQTPGKYAFFAGDLAHRSATFMPNVNVIAGGKKPLQVDANLLEQYTDYVEKNVAPGIGWTKVEAKLVQLNGVTCGRIVGDIAIGDLAVRQVQYLLPRGEQPAACIKYSADRERFSTYEPIFDAAARATEGIAATPSPFARVGRSAVRGAIFGGIAAAIAVPIFALLRRRRKS